MAHFDTFKNSFLFSEFSLNMITIRSNREKSRKIIISRASAETLTRKHIETFSLKIYFGHHKNSKFILCTCFAKFLNINTYC